MANSEKIYEAIVALRADSAQLRTDFSAAESVMKGGLGSLTSLASTLAPALSIGGLVAFGKSVIDTAGQLSDLAAQTGLSAQLLSGLKSPLEENGSSLEAFARGIFTAQKNLGGIDEESDRAAVALSGLGLSVDALKTASPEQFLEQVAGALAKIESPSQRAATGALIFGKAWRELAPILGDNAGKLSELKAAGMSDEDIKKLDDFGDALTRLGNTAKIVASGPLADFVDGIERIFSLTPQSKITNELVAINDALDKLQVTQNKTAAQLQEELSLRQRLVQISQIQLAEAKPKDKPPAVGGDMGAAATKDAEKAAADLLVVMRKLDQVGMTPLAKTLDDIKLKYAEMEAVGTRAFKGQEEKAAAFSTTLKKKLDIEIQSALSASKAPAALAAVNGEIERQTFLFDQGQVSAGALAKRIKEMGGLKSAFTEITKSANEFYQQGINPGTMALQNQLAKVGEVEATARKTYGLAIPESIQTAIDKMRGFVEQIAAANGVKLDDLKKNLAEMGPGIGASFVPTEGLSFLRTSAAEIKNMSADLGGGMEIVNGVITNMTGPVENIKTNLALVPGIMDLTKTKTDAAAIEFDGLQKNIDPIKTQLIDLSAAAAEPRALALDTTLAESGLSRVSSLLSGIQGQRDAINATPLKVVQ